MKTRTVILLILATLLGAAAAVATYNTVHSPRHTPVANDDQDPGLIP